VGRALTAQREKKNIRKGVEAGAGRQHQGKAYLLQERGEERDRKTKEYFALQKGSPSRGEIVGGRWLKNEKETVVPFFWEGEVSQKKGRGFPGKGGARRGGEKKTNWVYHALKKKGEKAGES